MPSRARIIYWSAGNRQECDLPREHIGHWWIRGLDGGNLTDVADKARRESELKSMSLNTTTDSLYPGEEIEWGTSPEEDGTQQVESNVKMGVVDRMRMGDEFVISTHEPKGSHTTPRNDETKQETDVGAAMDHPDELPQTGPRVSMS